MPRETASLIAQRVMSDLDKLPPKYPNNPEHLWIKMPPEYLGRSGNFYDNHSHAVQQIGECTAVCLDPSSNTIAFCDINNKWHSRYVPHVPRIK